MYLQWTWFEAKWNRKDIEVKSKWNRSWIEVNSKWTRSEVRSGVLVKWHWLEVIARPHGNSKRNGIEPATAKVLANFSLLYRYRFRYCGNLSWSQIWKTEHEQITKTKHKEHTYFRFSEFWTRLWSRTVFHLTDLDYFAAQSVDMVCLPISDFTFGDGSTEDIIIATSNML